MYFEELSAGFDEFVELSPCLLITTRKNKNKKEIWQFQQSSLASVVFH